VSVGTTGIAPAELIEDVVLLLLEPHAASSRASSTVVARKFDIPPCLYPDDDHG
jgi:hypothetical protein